MPKVGRTVQVACGLRSRRKPLHKVNGFSVSEAYTMPVAAGDVLLIYARQLPGPLR